jgi:hypothetical protein
VLRLKPYSHGQLGVQRCLPCTEMREIQALEAPACCLQNRRYGVHRYRPSSSLFMNPSRITRCAQQCLPSFTGLATILATRFSSLEDQSAPSHPNRPLDTLICKSHLLVRRSPGAEVDGSMEGSATPLDEESAVLACTSPKPGMSCGWLGKEGFRATDIRISRPPTNRPICGEFI